MRIKNVFDIRSNTYPLCDELGVDPPLVDEEVDGDGAPVLPPAGDPAVLLGLVSSMHPFGPSPTCTNVVLPPVPGPLSSPAINSTVVPARAFTVQLKKLLLSGALSRNVSPPGTIPMILT